jgi:hypothetical protein
MPYGGMTLCVEDGAVFWTAQCCLESLKRSCDGKPPDRVHVDPPKDA